MRNDQAGSMCAAHSRLKCGACIQAVQNKACFPCCRRCVGSTCHAALDGLLARTARQNSPLKTPQRRGLCWQTQGYTSWAPSRTSRSQGKSIMPKLGQDLQWLSGSHQPSSPARLPHNPFQIVAKTCSLNCPQRATECHCALFCLHDILTVMHCQCRDALCGLIMGSPPGKVYSKLRSVCSRLNSSY